MYKNFVTNFIRFWNFTRSETLEVLDSLDDRRLLFTPPGKEWQPLFYQFSYIGRTQIVYTEAIKTGKMDFSLFSSDKMPNKTDFQTKKELLTFLSKANKAWGGSIRKRRSDEEFVVVWPGFKQPLPVHITGLISHERMHIGQLISYFTLAGYELPKKFKTNWAL